MKFSLYTETIFFMNGNLLVISFIIYYFNPMAPSADYVIHLAKILISKCEGVIEKNFLCMSAASMSR